MQSSIHFRRSPYNIHTSRNGAIYSALSGEPDAITLVSPSFENGLFFICDPGGLK